MGIMDNLQDKAGDVMDNDKIEQFAKDKGISVEEAKQHFMNKDGQSE